MLFADLLALAFVLIFFMLYLAGIGYLLFRIMNQPAFSQSTKVRNALLVVLVPVFGAFIYVANLEPALKQNYTKKPLK